MSHSNFTEINIAGGTASGDGGDGDRGKDFENWNYGRNSISSRVSQSSPRDSLGSPSQLPHHSASSSSLNGYVELRKTKLSKRKAWYEKRTTVGLGLLLGFFFLMNWWMLFRIQEPGRPRGDTKIKSLKANVTTVFIRDELQKLGRGKKPQKTIYARLLAKAAHALAEASTSV